MFPPTLIVFQIFAILGIAYAFKNKDKGILALTSFSIVSLLVYLALDNSSILNARFLPPFILGYILVGAYGLGQSIRLSFNNRIGMAIAMTILTLSAIFFVKHSITYIPD
jgi:hypothetical protein